MGVADARCHNFVPAAHFFIDLFLDAFFCLFDRSVELFTVRLAQVQQIDRVGQCGFEIQTRFIILVHTVQALHRNDEVVIDLLDFRIMLLKVCQQTELAVQRSGVGLQVKLDFFTSLCIFSYKYFAVVDIHTLDHFAVCKQQELRVSSVIPFVQSCMDSHPEIFSIEALRNGDGGAEPVMFVRSVPAVIDRIKRCPRLF